MKMLSSSSYRHSGFRMWKIPGGTLNAASVRGEVRWGVVHAHDLREYLVDRAEVRSYWRRVIGQSIGNLSGK